MMSCHLTSHTSQTPINNSKIIIKTNLSKSQMACIIHAVVRWPLFSNISNNLILDYLIVISISLVSIIPLSLLYNSLAFPNK
jgi:hypothetical protein